VTGAPFDGSPLYAVTDSFEYGLIFKQKKDSFLTMESLSRFGNQKNIYQFSRINKDTIILYQMGFQTLIPSKLLIFNPTKSNTICVDFGNVTSEDHRLTLKILDKAAFDLKLLYYEKYGVIRLTPEDMKTE
jgi:hypothetical protein